jgi:hypothetical protein
MNVVIDDEVLEKARQITGKKTYSETINHLVSEIVRVDRLMKAVESLSNNPDAWYPGFVEEYGPNPPIRERSRRGRVAAKVVRAPKARRRGTR